MSDLARAVNHTDPTSQIACQQLTANRNSIGIPQTPFINLGADLYEVPNEIQFNFSLVIQRAGQHDVLGQQVLQLPEKLLQVYAEKLTRINSLVTLSPRSSRDPTLAQQGTSTGNRFDSNHQESNPDNTTLSPYDKIDFLKQTLVQTIAVLRLMQ